MCVKCKNINCNGNVQCPELVKYMNYVRNGEHPIDKNDEYIILEKDIINSISSEEYTKQLNICIMCIRDKMFKDINEEDLLLIDQLCDVIGQSILLSDKEVCILKIMDKLTSIMWTIADNNL